MDLPGAIRSVLLGTAVAGVAGGAMGAVLGRMAPSFFKGWGEGPTGETALALGAIAGLILGSLGCSLLAAVKLWADARAAAARDPDEEDES